MKEATKDFIEFQKKCPESIPLNKAVNFNKVNFKYADLASLMKVVKPIANECNFAIYHKIDLASVTAILSHVSGHEFISRVEIKQGLQAKDKGAEITYCKRYSLSALCGIVTEEDGDIKPMTPKLKEQINDKLFDQACERIKKGDDKGKKTYLETLKYFTLTEDQEKQLRILDLDWSHG